MAVAMAEKVQDKPAALKILQQVEMEVASSDDFQDSAVAILKYADDDYWIEAIKTQQEKRKPMQPSIRTLSIAKANVKPVNHILDWKS